MIIQISRDGLLGHVQYSKYWLSLCLPGFGSEMTSYPFSFPVWPSLIWLLAVYHGLYSISSPLCGCGSKFCFLRPNQSLIRVGWAWSWQHYLWSEEWSKLCPLIVFQIHNIIVHWNFWSIIPGTEIQLCHIKILPSTEEVDLRISGFQQGYDSILDWP